MNKTISNYIKLTKPRITMLVLVTAYLGYYLGLRSQDDHMVSLQSYISLCFLLIGTWTTSASASVINQVIERRQDSQMARTKNRPLVVGALSLKEATYFGSLLGVFGFISKLQYFIYINRFFYSC